MGRNKQHINTNPNGGNFFEKVEIPFQKSKEEVWASLSAKIEEKPEPGVINLFGFRPLVAVAASILLLAAVFSVMRFYTKSINCPYGQHLAISLPDRSSVELNAESTLKYHPLWWWASRDVRFEGEGFFQVQKGSAFTVHSAMGQTRVMGTSFNIYSRDKQYRVTCFTGKVQVTSQTNERVILSPSYTALVDPRGRITVKKENQPKITASWRKNMFNFTATPLSDVMKEVERQYGVSIRIEKPYEELFYTGFFSKDKTVEEVLSIICKPFGITYVKNTDGSYTLISNQ